MSLQSIGATALIFGCTNTGTRIDSIFLLVSDTHTSKTMELDANERMSSSGSSGGSSTSSSNSGNSVGTTEQLHSRHGRERIAASATNSHHDQFGISSAKSVLNSEIELNPTTPTSTTYQTEKCSPPKTLPLHNHHQYNNHNNNNNCNKSVIAATSTATTATTKQVLKKYFVQNSCNSSQAAATNSNSSDEVAAKSILLNCSGRSGGSGSGSSNHSNLSNWFPSKRNSLHLLVARSIEKNCKMVAMQDLSTGGSETTNDNYSFDDPSEELQYGPGIVSKLRCRYLSLALRQSVAKQRPSLDNLRRSTSLNNLIDEDENDLDADEVDDDSGHGIDANGHANGYDDIDKSSAWQRNGNATKSAFANDANDDDNFLIVDHNGHSNDIERQPKITANWSKSRRFGAGRGESRRNDDDYAAQKPPIRPTQFGGGAKNTSEMRCRQTQRGNDSLKRARSVEALMRYDTLAWRRDQLNDSEEYPSSNPIILDELIVSESTMVKTKTAQDITIEDKIQQARERVDMKTPKRLTSFMDETERPPPDLVKQTLLKFEATANRRPRGNLQRYGNGDVAAKVATFRLKISQDKATPAIAYPKPMPLSSPTTTITSPLSPSKKPMIKPRTNSPKPMVLNGGAVTTNGSTTTKSSGIDINLIRTNLERANLKTNGVPAATIAATATNGHAIRIDTTSYRTTKLETSLLSPEMPAPNSRLSSRLSPIAVPDSPRVNNALEKKSFGEQNVCESPTINLLTRRTENLMISTPKSNAIDTSPTAVDGDANALLSDDVVSCDSDADSSDDEDGQNSSNGCTGSYDVNMSDNYDSDNSAADASDKFVLNKKHVSKSAPENISTAGATTKFAFDSTKATAIPSNTKSYLPVINNSIVNGTASVRSAINIGGSGGSFISDQLSPPEPSVRQIGIIRPLIASVPMPSEMLIRNDMPKQPPPPPPPVASVRSTSTVTSTTDNDVVVIECGANLRPVFGPSSASLRPVHGQESSAVEPWHFSNAMASDILIRNDLLNDFSKQPSTTSSPSPSSSSSMVHQKNLLNKEKSDEASASGTNGASVMIQLPVKWTKKSTSIITSSPILSAAIASPTPPSSQSPGKSRQPADIQAANTMVFNFSNRKEVPDYIENDGLVIRRKRELPKVSFVIFSLHFIFSTSLNFHPFCVCFEMNV